MKPCKERVDAYLRLLKTLPAWEPEPKRGARQRRRERSKSWDALVAFGRRWNDERPI